MENVFLFLYENTYYSFCARTKRCLHFSNSRRFCKFVIHDIYVLGPPKRVSLCQFRKRNFRLINICTNVLLLLCSFNYHAAKVAHIRYLLFQIFNNFSCAQRRIFFLILGINFLNNNHFFSHSLVCTLQIFFLFILLLLSIQKSLIMCVENYYPKYFKEIQ